MTGRRPRARRATPASRWAIIPLLALVTASCDVLNSGLDVTAPDKIETKTLETPENAQLLLNGAIGDFECAYGAFVVVGGLMSGELLETTQTAARWSLDRRDADPSETLYSTGTCEGLGTYTPISVARGSADNVLTLLSGWTDQQVPDRTRLRATAEAYAGYSRILLGELFCEAAIDAGPRLSSADLFAQAEERLTSAITDARAAADANILNFALVGRARARLDRGDKAGAAADAALVPAGFVYNMTAEIAPDRRSNRVYAQSNGRVVSVAAAYRHLTVNGASGSTIADPRVVVQDAGRDASDNQTPMFAQTKYATGNTPIPIASYVEAQLILAEATGGAPGLAILNALRAGVGIGPIQGADIANLGPTIVQERARWLFLEGQHLFDTRRFNTPLTPAPGTPYSIVYAKGGSYGSERCFPIPNVEVLNNPNAS